ncbi:hypothetical protein X777_16501 [Ooceraea biroi]|uniref:Uncharacterized protein n=1 Tax=Ooceraea biroi TaxID=2015173 RepID=A0A026VWL8_OOCBI|nr:hypothetical protein X777_16501 [Ooceraea biroi]
MRARVTRCVTDAVVEGDPGVTPEPYHPKLPISGLIGNFIKTQIQQNYSCGVLRLYCSIKLTKVQNIANGRDVEIRNIKALLAIIHEK